MQNIIYSIACLIAILGWQAAPALAEDKKFSAPVPFARLTAAVKSAQIEAGFDVTRDNLATDIPAPGQGSPPRPYVASQARLFSRVPVTGDDDSTRVQLDRFTARWKIGVRLARQWDQDVRVPDSGWLVQHRLAVSTDYGWGRFEYFPTGDEMAPEKDSHSSVAGELEYRQYRAKNAGGAQRAPQLRIRYARDWKAADKVGVVVPGTPPVPDTTRDLIVAAPSVAPETSLRLASPFTAGNELGHGPGLTYTLKGEPGDYLPGAKVGRLRGEWYFYWFPSGLKHGGRIGLAPFLDLRTHGTDKLHGVEYGAIVDLRLETTLLEY